MKTRFIEVPINNSALKISIVSIALVLSALFLSLPASAAEASDRLECELVKFCYAPNTSAQSVSIAGSFNEWNKDASPMKETAGGMWEAEIEVPAGSHQYKFVINNSVWVSDPSNPETMDDGQGGKNSVIHAGGKLYARLEKVSNNDDTVEIDGLMHKPTEIKYIDFTDTASVRLVVRSFKNDLVSASILKAKDKNSRFELSEMKKFACDGIYDYYRSYFDNCDSKSVYLFQLNSGGRNAYYGYKGIFEPKTGQGSLYDNAFGVPDYFFLSINRSHWWPDAIFYQIFPDRFFDGDKSLNQDFVQKWGSAPVMDNFTGGDIKGINEKVPHLKKLGVNAVYLNPIFKSFSNHKYDTVHYFEIDPTLGALSDFKALIDTLHGAGIKIILDGVFNHTSTDFFAFADVRKNGEKSEFKDWFNFKSFPVNMQKPNYDCWWNIGSMPKLNIKNPDVYDFLLSVAHYWMKNTAIDGFRLDVPEELPHSFWKDFRKAVKSYNKEAYIVGEIWSDGSKWLAGDQFDGVMNYRLRNSLLSFFVKKDIKAGELDIKLAADKINLPDSAFFSMLNLLGSHDTPRILSVCGGDKATLYKMITFIMAYPGAPCVYYGDEIGLDGDKDPQNRKCMEWDGSKWKMDIYNFYKKAIAWRNDNIELRRGALFTYSTDDKAGVYSFARVYKNSAVVATFSNSGELAGQAVNFRKIFNFTDYEPSAFADFKTAAVTDLISGAIEKYDIKDKKEFETGVKKDGFALYKISFEKAENK